MSVNMISSVPVLKQGLEIRNVTVSAEDQLHEDSEGSIVVKAYHTMVIPNTESSW